MEQLIETYLAHIAEDGRMQSCHNHLLGTAKLAQSFAEDFGYGELGYQTGLAHDIGKYSDAFQKRIRGSSLTADHSTWGTQEILKAMGHAAPAYCIAGHHGGLPNGGSPTDTDSAPTLMGRLRKKAPNTSYLAYQKEVALQKTYCQPPAPLGKGGFTESFWIRMLFSCLVDADFLDTEAFMQNGAPVRSQQIDISDLLNRLNAHISPWWDSAKPLNQARCKILRACLEAGSCMSPGLFTLTVPTGGGKTVSSLAFALKHAERFHKKRIIYIIPYTSIIEQTADTYYEILGKENVLEHHCNIDYDDPKEENADPLNNMKKLATENWDMPVIVTTAVQFFESLFACKPSRCRKLHNLTDSVIIFDEAQTLPRSYLIPCLHAIAELSAHYGASCILCTATQPALQPFFQKICPNLPLREIAPSMDLSIFHRVTFQHLGKLEDEELTERLNQHDQVLCIVSTRKHAQTLYEQLDPNGSFHLSTLMTPHHRRTVLEEVRRRLKENLPCRVVSTSLIEAGVDVDFPVVYRSEAGLDSEIQAAGRCNREGKRSAAESMVYIFKSDGTYTATLPPDMKRPMEIACDIKCGDRRLDDPQVVQEYFSHLYHYDGASLDFKNIVKQIEDSNPCYPFRDIADKFHLIQNDTRSILIPNTEDALELASKLHSGESNRSLLRRAGPFSVNIYPEHFESLNAHGVLEILDENIAILTDLSFYHENTGLVRLAESGIGIFI